MRFSVYSEIQYHGGKPYRQHAAARGGVVAADAAG
jgi:hypothetical protein